MKKWIKLAAICIFGAVLSFVLLSIFVEIDLLFNDTNAATYETAVKFAGRLDWVYFPAIVLTVSIVVTFLDRTNKSALLCAVAIVPLILSYIAASSFSARGFIFLGVYFLIATGIGLTLPHLGKKLSIFSGSRL